MSVIEQLSAVNKMPDNENLQFELISELQKSHQSELQRLHLLHVEQVRKIEVARLHVEEKLEMLDESHAELSENHRVEIQQLTTQLLTAKDSIQQYTVDIAAFEKRMVQIEVQRDELDAERRRLNSQLHSQDDELQGVRNQLRDLENRLASKEIEVQQATTQLLAAKDTIQRFTVDIAALEQRMVQTEIQRNELDAERRRLNSQLHSQDDELHGVRDQLRDLENRIASKEIEVQQLTTQLLTAKNSIQQFTVDMAAFEKRILQNEIQRDELDAEHHRFNKQLQNQLALSQQDVARYRSALVDADRRADAVKKTFAFRLGHAFIHNTKSWQGIKKLPGILLTIHRDAKQRRAQADSIGVQTNELSIKQSEWMTKLENLFAERGLESAEVYARSSWIQPIDTATALTRLARLELKSNVNDSIRLARESVSLDPRPFRQKWLAFLLFDAGHIVEPHELLLSLPKGQSFKTSEKFKAEYIAGCYCLINGLPEIPVRLSESSIVPIENRILYVASSSLPHHITGYTSRTHAVIKAISSKELDVISVTRPGYPYDRGDALSVATKTSHVYDGVRYEILDGPHRRKMPLDQYLFESAKIIEAKARIERPAIIHAASNYEAAIPALIAARRLGIPFVYEVRGLWEYTAATKIPDWENTERFTLDKQLESLAATNADQVLTLTQAMSEELQSRGVCKNKITLAPNAINPKSFQPISPATELRATLGLNEATFVIGYIGSVLAYEGLDDLVTAFNQIVKKITGAKLLIVGDGDAMPALRSQIKSLGLEADVVLVGKVLPAEVQQYFSLMNVIALPRKPFKVCQLVSPLKPLEAMSMGIPLVVSDVAALKEMVKENETALVHKSGDVYSLVDCILRIAQEDGLGMRLAKAAREDVLANRTWELVATSIVQVYKALTKVRDSTVSNFSNVLSQDVKESAENSVLLDDISSEIEPITLPVGKNVMSAEEKSLFDEKLKLSLKRGGIPKLMELVEKQTSGRSIKFVAFCEIKAANAALAAGYVDHAAILVKAALQKDSTLTTLRGAARIYYNAAMLGKAIQLLDQIEKSQDKISDGDKKFIAEVRGRTQLAEWSTMPTALRNVPAVKGRVLNVLAFSLPYTSVGYATRSHGLAIGIKNAGWDVCAYTRPGFPYDFEPELEGKDLPEQDEIDGVVYKRLFDIDRSNMSEVEYLLAAITHYEKVITHEQPEIVHAASNYVTALPALIAARRLGVPFIYEMRGFWEVTRSSRDEEFVNTTKYRFMQMFEGLVARNADHVITITTAMKEELVKRGVLENKISIAFNSVDPDRFIPTLPNKSLAKKLDIPNGVPVIGYVGSFVDYEGLDDLVTAAAGLKEAGHDYRLLLVGDGAVFESLTEQIKSLKLEDKVILTGRVPHEEVEDYYSLIDIAPFPRKPWEVCELVSPLKPFEAMALEKAVVVSSTQALMEIVSHDSNGLVFEKGNVGSLQETLAKLISNPKKRLTIGKSAREWIERERSWDVAGLVCNQVYGINYD